MDKGKTGKKRDCREMWSKNLFTGRRDVMFDLIV